MSGTFEAAGPGSMPQEIGQGNPMTGVATLPDLAAVKQRQQGPGRAATTTWRAPRYIEAVIVRR